MSQSTVKIYTKMGKLVDEGNAVFNNESGVMLENGTMYSSLIYDAVGNVEPEIVVPDSEVVEPEKLSLEDRVNAKAESKGFTVSEADVAKKDSDKDGVPDSKDAQGGDEDGEGIDLDALPMDIKKAVVSAGQMDSSDLNSVLSEVGDSIVKSLRRVNMDDENVYDIVGQIQKCAKNVLTKKTVNKRTKEKT